MVVNRHRTTDLSTVTGVSPLNESLIPGGTVIRSSESHLGWF